MDKRSKEPETRSVELRIRVRPSEAEKLRELTERDGEDNMSAIVRRAIRQYIESDGK